MNVSNGFDLSFKKIKDNIIFRVIGENKLNEYRKKYSGNILYHLLENEMYMIYAIELNQNMSIIFTDFLVKKIGCSEKQVVELAKKNTEKLYPPVLKNMENIIFENIVVNNKKNININILESEKLYLNSENESKMYVLTNNQAKYGASVIFYDGILRKVSKIFGDDLFLIPSSIHEIILLPKYAQVTKENLNVILNDVNENFLDNEDILGVNVMMYDAKREKIVIEF